MDFELLFSWTINMVEYQHLSHNSTSSTRLFRTRKKCAPRPFSTQEIDYRQVVPILVCVDFKPACADLGGEHKVEQTNPITPG